MSTAPVLPVEGTGARLPHSGIRVMMERARAVANPIDLSVGEPDFHTPAHIIEATTRALATGATHYSPTPGMPELRAAIAERATAASGRPTRAEETIVTVGAVGSLAGGYLAVLAPGDTVLLPDPGWPNYTSLALLAGAEPVSYPLRPENGFVPDPEEIAALITPATKAVVINTPGNPTGAVWPVEVVERIVRAAEARGVRVIADEVYEGFADGEGAPGGRAVTARAVSDQVIAISGCSKSYAMTGWRIGHAVAPAEVVAAMTRIQEPLVSCPPTISQIAALAALTGPQEVVAEMAATYRRRRSIVTEELAPHGLLPSPPCGAFYALADLRGAGLLGESGSTALLDRAGVVTVPGSAFGKVADGFVRLSFATDDATVRAGCRAVAELARTAGGSA